MFIFLFQYASVCTWTFWCSTSLEPVTNKLILWISIPLHWTLPSSYPPSFTSLFSFLLLLQGILSSLSFSVCLSQSVLSPQFLFLFFFSFFFFLSLFQHLHWPGSEADYHTVCWRLCSTNSVQPECGGSCWKETERKDSVTTEIKTTLTQPLYNLTKHNEYALEDSHEI